MQCCRDMPTKTAPASASVLAKPLPNLLPQQTYQWSLEDPQNIPSTIWLCPQLRWPVPHMGRALLVLPQSSDSLQKAWLWGLIPHYYIYNSERHAQFRVTWICRKINPPHVIFFFPLRKQNRSTTTLAVLKLSKLINWGASTHQMLSLAAT